ncbi:hypothetical protein PTSG_07372 [Salpingoeca rosetta]|uniref:Uncharacterized protein n=1 Tax=Salpingoeca rosetta (strain ATCC 50818 / BSB-021) TaxID=946362 RepID=F2UII1_SALR5|nr:uncharacterized protein PTSG_07372 [Salpingoeca rosetta]EGD77030.1 hypothetical protein PTSG_07372 [Salpingoeca rosetta]|eukprot:XP_004990870.1 hypothetical protein PTSG_07372 [Salpingoeca rosetta]
MATTTTTTTSSGTSGTSGIAAMQARSGRTRDLAARVAALRKEVTQLRKEWAAAQEESVDQHHVDAIMKQLLTAEQTTEGDKDRPAPHKSVQHVEVDDALGHVKTMASLSGITFTEVTTSVTRNPEGAAISNTGTHRTYNLKGTCHGLGFFLTFAVNEQRTSQTIERVAAHVDDICKPELSRFVQRVERSRSPQLFFQGFAQYARVNAERQRVVQELLRSYPEVVSVPTAPHMQGG